MAIPRGAEYSAMARLTARRDAGPPPAILSIPRQKLRRQRRTRLEGKRLPGELVVKRRLERVQEEALLLRYLGELAIRGEVAVSLVADNGHVVLRALHAQLVAAAGAGLKKDERGRKRALGVANDLVLRLDRHIANGRRADLSALPFHRDLVAPDITGLLRPTEHERVVDLAHLLLREVPAYGQG